MTPTAQPSLGRLIALLMIGFGLLAIGIMFVLLPKDTYSTSEPVAAQDFSAVPTKVDFVAPDLSLTTLTGEKVTLADYQGAVVLVNLWATWCPPCREEMPALKAFYEKHKANGFELIAIDQGEGVEEVDAFVKEFDLPFPVWMDMGSLAGSRFNTMNLPSSYVIDRSGRVKLMWIGGISASNLEKYVPDVIME